MIIAISFLLVREIYIIRDKKIKLNIFIFIIFLSHVFKFELIKNFKQIFINVIFI